MDLSPILCDQNVLSKFKDKLYKMIVRPEYVVQDKELAQPRVVPLEDESSRNKNFETDV